MTSRRHASLKPHLNQVRGWVEMGATDLWIAHQLGSTPASIAAFRQKHGLLRTGAERAAPSAGGAAEGTSRRAAPAPRDAAPPSEAPKPRRRRTTKAERTADAEAVVAAAPGTSAEPAAAEEPEVAADATPSTATATADGDGERPKRRRGRRGGRGRGKGGADAPLELEGVFDHGDEGYGLWLDGAVRDAAVYRTHWRGQREVVVRVTPDEIVIRRAGSPADVDD